MVREFFNKFKTKKEQINSEENPEIAKLKEIINNKLKSGEVPVVTFEEPDQPGIEEYERKEKLKEISDSEKSLRKTTEQIKLIESFAEKLLREHQVGITPDDKYLEDVADIAIDYYQPYHHETVRSSDEHLTNIERKSWEKEKNERIEETVNQLKERLEGK